MEVLPSVPTAEYDPDREARPSQRDAPPGSTSAAASGPVPEADISDSDAPSDDDADGSFHPSATSEGEDEDEEASQGEEEDEEASQSDAPPDSTSVDAADPASDADIADEGTPSSDDADGSYHLPTTSEGEDEDEDEGEASESSNLATKQKSSRYRRIYSSPESSGSKSSSSGSSGNRYSLPVPEETRGHGSSSGRSSSRGSNSASGQQTSSSGSSTSRSSSSRHNGSSNRSSPSTRSSSSSGSPDPPRYEGCQDGVSSGPIAEHEFLSPAASVQIRSTIVRVERLTPDRIAVLANSPARAIGADASPPPILNLRGLPVRRVAAAQCVRARLFQGEPVRSQPAGMRFISCFCFNSFLKEKTLRII